MERKKETMRTVQNDSQNSYVPRLLSDCIRTRSRFGLVGLVALLAAVTLWPQTQHGVLWSWSAVTADTAGNAITVDGYNLYCSTAAAGPFVKANTGLIPSTSFLETGLVLGSTNFCQVTAVKNSLAIPESAHSPTSAGVVFQFPLAVPAAPAGAVTELQKPMSNQLA